MNVKFEIKHINESPFLSVKNDVFSVNFLIYNADNLIDGFKKVKKMFLKNKNITIDSLASESPEINVITLSGKKLKLEAADSLYEVPGCHLVIDFSDFDSGVISNLFDNLIEDLEELE